MIDLCTTCLLSSHLSLPGDEGPEAVELAEVDPAAVVAVGQRHDGPVDQSAVSWPRVDQSELTSPRPRSCGRPPAPPAAAARPG